MNITMERVFLFVVILGFALKCSATLYTVGDNSGWDISTDLDSWEKSKTFLVGDVLVFQYSSYHSVSEVAQPDYEGCNTTNVLQSSSNGNTSYPLTKAGDRFFICGNRLHCLGGMKLQVHVQEDQSAATPAASPGHQPKAESGGSQLPPGSTKSNTPISSAAAPAPALILFDSFGFDHFAFFTFLFGVSSLFIN